jgi:1-acyl-sn-glycerol-3-phosphate acyltransferase
VPAVPRPWLVGLARALTGLFFRRIEVEGIERVPRDGPLLVVANHHNSLVDPALVLARLPRAPRFLAKSTLWRTPGLRLLLDAAGSIPVYRRQDTGEDLARNRETFARCHEALAAGGAVALFPEGISHDAPRLASLKTGAARIALETRARFPDAPLRILPVGLVFDQKGKFRSRALLRVGEPFAAPAASPDRPAARDAVRALTQQIRDALHTVTLNYPEGEEPSLLDRTAEVWAVRERPLPAQLALAEAFALRRIVIEAYARLRESDPEAVARARRVAARYEAALRHHGLRDDHVAARYPLTRVAAFLVGTLSLLAFWLPFAAVGSLLSWLPYQTVRAVSRLSKTPDLPATLKLLGGLVFYPVAWLLEAALAGWLLGPLAAALVLALAPPTAYVAMLFHERYEQFFVEASAYAKRLLRRRSLAELRREREAFRAQIDALRARLERRGGRSDRGPGEG